MRARTVLSVSLVTLLTVTAGACGGAVEADPSGGPSAGPTRREPRWAGSRARAADAVAVLAGDADVEFAEPNLLGGEQLYVPDDAALKLTFGHRLSFKNVERDSPKTSARRRAT